MKTVVIYHGNCYDGFGAAWVVRQAFKSQLEHIEFYPAAYQQDPPDVKGKHVIIVDFSYKRPVMEQILKDAFSVILLDHHKTAFQDLHDLESEKLIKVFDMERSGAMIAWNYFFPQEEPPRLIYHIQDRDLWRFKLDGTAAIQSALESYSWDFEIWDMLMADKIVHGLEDMGRNFLRKHNKNIQDMIKAATRRAVIDGYNVPIINVPFFMGSDTCHILCQGEPFAAYYWDSKGMREFGLRSSENGGVDVSLIAAKFGGGGHKHAAGFKIKRPGSSDQLEIIG